MKHLLSNFGQRFSAQTHLEIKQLQAFRILLQNSISCAYQFLTHQPSIKCIRFASCSYVECVPLHSRVGVGVWVVKHLEVRLPASKRTDCCISVVSVLYQCCCIVVSYIHRIHTEYDGINRIAFSLSLFLIVHFFLLLRICSKNYGSRPKIAISNFRKTFFNPPTTARVSQTPLFHTGTNCLQVLLRSHHWPSVSQPLLSFTAYHLSYY